jgi:branched-chain amino acid transport system permease protein
MFLQQLINGLCIGATYSLIAIGYSLVFGVLSFINFAHGNICMFGAYMTWYLLTKLNIGFPVALFGGVVTSMILGVIIEKIGYLPLRRASKLSLLVISLGFSFILEISVHRLWSPQPQHMPPVIPLKSFIILNSRFNLMQIAILVMSLVLMALFYIFIQKTKIGITLRAVALDQNTSGLMGVNVNNMVSLLFALGSAIGALSAIMLAIYYGTVYTTMGATIGMKGFIAVIFGGVGSIPGAMFGGLIIGVLESLSGAYISSGYKEGITFIALIIILLLKPSGLFGKEIMKEG